MRRDASSRAMLQPESAAAEMMIEVMPSQAMASPFGFLIYYIK